MAKYTEQYKVSIEEIIEYNAEWGNNVINYMANIRKDIEEKDHCDNGEVWEATLWAEHQLNTLATENAELHARVQELEADLRLAKLDSDIYYTQKNTYHKLAETIQLELNEANATIEAFALYGTDTPPATDSAGNGAYTGDTEPVQPLDGADSTGIGTQSILNNAHARALAAEEAVQPLDREAYGTEFHSVFWDSERNGWRVYDKIMHTTSMGVWHNKAVAIQRAYKSDEKYHTTENNNVDAVNPTLESFRESYAQAIRGETYPIEMLWSALEDDTDDEASE